MMDQQNLEMDEVVNKVSDVTLSDNDDDVEIDIPPDATSGSNLDLRFALVGRFVTDRFIRLHEMRNVHAANWQPGKGVAIQEISPQLFLFQFGHKADMRRIMDGGAWAYDNHVLVYERVQQGVDPETIPLTSLAIWVQVWQLPVGYMLENVLKCLGNKLGEFLEVDPNNFTGVRRDYLRLRVKI